MKVLKKNLQKLHWFSKFLAIIIIDKNGKQETLLSSYNENDNNSATFDPDNLEILSFIETWF